ncbi:MAG: S8 family serine peptidase, partial [Planctomycetota bacterium]
NDGRKLAIDALLENGVATVVSAGNEGFTGSVGAPGCISTAYTVGSLQDDLNLSSFTNRGQLLDVFAPGSDIESSVLGGYDSINGTSMAAPHVAGALAQLRQAFPDRPITELMDVLKTTGRPITYFATDANGQLITATTPLIQAIAASASFGDDHVSSIDVFSTPMLSSERGSELFGTPTLGRLETWGDVDTFRFTAEAGTQIQFSTSGRLPSGTMRLYRNSNSFLQTALVQNGMTFNVPSTGEYFLQIDGTLNNLPLFIGDYGIFLSHNDDHGRYAAIATPITRDVPAAGQLEVLGNEDWFSFTANTGEELVLETTGLTFERITLFGSDGITPLDFADGGFGYDARLEFTAPANNTYYARVTSDDTGDYELTLFDNPGDPGDLDDQLSEANVAAVGFGFDGTISEATDVDMYVFNAIEGETLGIDLDIATGLDSVLRLFDVAGNQLNINDNASGPLPEFSNDESYIEHTFADTGPYYIGVSSSSNIGYDPVTGDGDVAGDTVGSYSLLFFEIANTSNADFNGDGILDGVDIDALVANIALGPSDPMTFDLTGDGMVDLDDRDAWLAAAGAQNLPSGNPYLLGDATLDGVVDVSDFNAWNTYKFTNQAAWTRGDFNADGSVEVSDFNAWNGNKFTSSDSSQRRSGRTDTDPAIADAVTRRSPLTTAVESYQSLDELDQGHHARDMRRTEQRSIANRRRHREEVTEVPFREELSD